MVVMMWQYCILILIILLISQLKVWIIVILFMTLTYLQQFIFLKVLCLMTVYIYITHIKEINIKNRVHDYYFCNLGKTKKLASKHILIDEKSYKDLNVYFARHVHSQERLGR